MGIDINKEKNFRQVKRLVNAFTKMTLMDILAIANILGVEEEEQFEDFITNICAAFTKQPRNMRRKLLKLAEDVAKADKELELNKENKKN